MINAKIDGLLVSVHWLAENLNAENLVILDASMPPVTAVDNNKTQAEQAEYKNLSVYDGSWSE